MAILRCQELRCALPNALPNYVMGRTLFDTSISFEELAREYFSAAYGDDWEKVYSYLTDISSLCSCDYFNGKGSRDEFRIRLAIWNCCLPEFIPLKLS